MNKILAFLVSMLVAAAPLYAEQLVIVDDMKGLATNPGGDSIAESQHTKFENMYIKDKNAQVVEGRDKKNSSAHADTTVNGLFYYESPSAGATRKNTQLLLHCDGSDEGTTITDSSDQAHSPVAIGDTNTETGTFQFATASCEFDGIDDEINVPDSIFWNTSTLNFTIDFWVNFTSLSSDAGLFGQSIGTSEEFYFIWETSNQLRFAIRADDADQLNITWAWTPSTATWYHVAFVRNGNSWTVYIDGTSLGSNSSSVAGRDISSELDIGAATDGGGTVDRLVGYIDEFSWERGVAHYTSNFTAPTVEHTISGSGVEKFIVAESDEIVTYNTDYTNRTQIASGLSDSDWDFLQIDTALYMTDENNAQWKWLGSGNATDMTNSGGATAKPPAYEYISVYRDVVFMALDYSLRFSDAVGEDETTDEEWATDNHLTVGCNQYKVTGLRVIRDSMLIYTAGCIQQLSGFGSTFEVRTVVNGVGAINTETIESDTNGDHIFFAGALGVFKIRVGSQLTDTSKEVAIERTDTTVTKLSTDLNDVFRGTDSDIDLDPTDYSDSHAYYDLENDLYFLYIAEHTFIYDNINKSWSHLPASRMTASVYKHSADVVNPTGVLIDNVGFFYENWTGYENGVETGTVTGNPTSATASTITDTGAAFDTTDDGLTGVWVAVVDTDDSYTGTIQYAQIASNTATVLTLSSAFTTTPDTGYSYYIGYIIPDWKTKQWNFAKAPNESAWNAISLVHEKSDASQTLYYDYFLDKSTTRKNTTDKSLDLNTNFVDKKGAARGLWTQFGFRSYVYNTSDSVSPPVNVINYTAHLIGREQE